MSDETIESGPRPLVVLAGGGRFPALVAASARRAGRQVSIAGIIGEADRTIEAFDHLWIGRGHVSRLIAFAKKRGAGDLVIVGGIKAKRPPTFAEFDLADVWIVLTHLPLLLRREDGILRRVARFFEGRGLRVIGAAEAAPDLLMPAGALGAVQPSAEAEASIRLGVAAAMDHGLGDVGQGVVMLGPDVVLREGWAGTDAMIADFAALPDKGSAPGVLVKCPKPIQDMRLDMPAIGPETVRAAAAAGLAGIAVIAGQTLVAEREAVATLADRAGLFVYGVEAA